MKTRKRNPYDPKNTFKFGPFDVEIFEDDSAILDCTNCGRHSTPTAFFKTYGPMLEAGRHCICPDCLASSGTSLGVLIWNFLCACSVADSTASS